jgi:hypothetical protein
MCLLHGSEFGPGGPDGRNGRATRPAQQSHTAACLDLARVLWWTIAFAGFTCDQPDRGFALV